MASINNMANSRAQKITVKKVCISSEPFHAVPLTQMHFWRVDGTDLVLGRSDEEKETWRVKWKL